MLSTFMNKIYSNVVLMGLQQDSKKKDCWHQVAYDSTNIKHSTCCCFSVLRKIMLRALTRVWCAIFLRNLLYVLLVALFFKKNNYDRACACKLNCNGPDEYSEYRKYTRSTSFCANPASRVTNTPSS